VKIKRYLDKDMRHVLRRVREDQGPDAVILSNRRVDDGIEVIAAIDYDEALVRQAMGVPADTNDSLDTDILAQYAEDDVASPIQAPVEIVSSELVQQPIGDHAVQQLHSELSSMRELLETQLSGLVWKDASRRFPLRAQILRNLSLLGVAPDISNMIVDRIGPADDVKNL